jgi:hypothetical protein
MNKFKLIFFVCLILFCIGNALCQSTLLLASNTTNDQIINPSGFFFDKGFGAQLNYRNQIVYKSGMSSSPYNGMIGLKYVYKGKLDRKKALSKRFFPGAGIILNRNSSGSMFIQNDFGLQFGGRLDLKKTGVNDYLATALEFRLSSLYARYVNYQDLHLIDEGDPSFLFISGTTGAFPSVKLGVSINKTILSDKIFYSGLSYYQPLGEQSLPILNSPILAASFRLSWYGLLDYTTKSQMKKLQAYSMSSFSLPIVYYFSNQLQIAPYFERPLKLTPLISPGIERIPNTFRVGMGTRLNLMSPVSNLFNSIFITFKYEFGNSNYQNAFRQTRHEAGVGYDQFLGPLITTTCGPNISYTFNTEKLSNECIFKEREFYRIRDEDKNIARAIQFYESEFSTMPCFESDPIKSVQWIADYLKLIQTKQSEEILLTRINNVNWSAKNISLEKDNSGQPIKKAKNAQEWEELCSKGTPACCYYNFDETNKSFGLIYNVYAASRIAPKGYRVSTPTDWKQIEQYAKDNWLTKNSQAYSIQCLIYGTELINPSFCASSKPKSDFNHQHWGILNYDLTFDKKGKTGTGGYWAIDLTEFDPIRGTGIGSAIFKGTKPGYIEDPKSILEVTKQDVQKKMPYFGLYIRLIKE